MAFDAERQGDRPSPGADMDDALHQHTPSSQPEEVAVASGPDVRWSYSLPAAHKIACFTKAR